MKFIINEQDLPKIVGKFIIQIDSDKPNLKLTDKDVNLSFYFSKRIGFIARGGKGILKVDIYGNATDYDVDTFIKVFNNYEFSHMTEEQKGTRYHRLLYSEELDMLFNRLKEMNY